ncbi:neuronal acetylcholine receptor subunit alpha-7-like isoform X7 [Phyllopteryx taeniolatus]|uniref:neuronal acetylcholine receptor subunit alpha-7-like isoform X7 n=1 Tax=Phyllopteryx taeniolatus TaxID=161469 RepID=UPI002AD2E8A0|nr:neuronal acetylcholine receptor subunit alpha-7-like isoform X7 [Phyllopteryx taeniolatus]
MESRRTRESILVGFYLWATLSFQGCHGGVYQRKLYRDLMVNYNRLERPVQNDSAPILVELGLTLLQIIDVDEKNQVLITNAWLQLFMWTTALACIWIHTGGHLFLPPLFQRAHDAAANYISATDWLWLRTVTSQQQWTDVYLTWNAESYPGVQNLRFPSNLIWVPDILLYNSADERFDATFHTNVLVNATGSCQYIPPGILKSTCYIDVRWFPFDVQKCDLKFGSWTHNGWLLDLQMMDVDISSYIPNGEWDLVGVPAKRNELYYDCCKEPYPDVTFTVTMRRRTLYYGLNLLIPCVLISGLALLVFLLPADSGEKISLGITVLLSLTVFMLLVAEIMPATSDSVPLIGKTDFCKTTGSPRFTNEFRSYAGDVTRISASVLCQHNDDSGLICSGDSSGSPVPPPRPPRREDAQMGSSDPSQLVRLVPAHEEAWRGKKTKQSVWRLRILQVSPCPSSPHQHQQHSDEHHTRPGLHPVN